jgi:hypothetical protein
LCACEAVCTIENNLKDLYVQNRKFVERCPFVTDSLLVKIGVVGFGGLFFLNALGDLIFQ